MSESQKSAHKSTKTRASLAAANPINKKSMVVKGTRTNLSTMDEEVCVRDVEDEQLTTARPSAFKWSHNRVCTN